ncbi:hypothetical protein GCM10007386_50450 [Pseudoduganella dura]|nr:hypothetical protein GCM10007386_50450 [Pseudoduganella dura]
MATVALIAGAGVPAAATPAPAPATAPDFGPNVLVFDPATPSATIQAALESIAGEAEFGSGRHAVLFKPGAYNVDAQIGYYTTAAGLGRHPDDVTINGGLRVEGRIDWSAGTDSALINFWRSVENLSITPTGGTTRWAVSQASPMRRVHIRGGLELMPAWWGYSSGGFIADSRIDGQVQSGSQQQWYTRDSAIGNWAGSVWNMVFSGVQGAPAQTFPAPPVTALATTPRSREKPFLYIDADGAYHVFKPDLRVAAAGTSWSGDGTAAEAGTSIPIGDFLIARPATPTADINAALAHGRHVLFTPGVYRLTEQLNVTRRNTVLLGLGMATLVPGAGQAAIATGNGDGIAIAGLIVDAAPGGSPVLVQVGPRPGTKGFAALPAKGWRANPTLLSDVFFRIGGPAAGSAAISLEVNSPNVIIDHLWAWRADHGAGAAWAVNRADTGLVVNGDDVTGLGLFVEHYQKHQLVWNGDNGQTIFYQSELPYDPPSQAEWMDGEIAGYASYNVGAGVKKQRHRAGRVLVLQRRAGDRRDQRDQGACYAGREDRACGGRVPVGVRRDLACRQRPGGGGQRVVVYQLPAQLPAQIPAQVAVSIVSSAWRAYSMPVANLQAMHASSKTVR